MSEKGSESLNRRSEKKKIHGIRIIDKKKNPDDIDYRKEFLHTKRDEHKSYAVMCFYAPLNVLIA